SIPKHAAIFDDEKKNEERRRRNCLYDPEVYDRMLSDSLQVCDLLQSHLNECIVTVRAKSPTPKPTSPTPFYYSPPPAHRGLPPTGRSMTSVPASPVTPHRSSVSVSSSAVTRKAESLEPPPTTSAMRNGHDTELGGSAKGSLSPSLLGRKAHKKLQFADQ
ncbi:Protein E01G6.2, partial [Aphelenchoides avenae]